MMLSREEALELEKYGTMNVEVARLVVAHHNSSMSSPLDAQPAPQPSTPRPSLLLHAIQDGDLSMVRTLIELGTSVEAGVTHGDVAPITAACMSGHLEIAKYLFGHGAHITGVYSSQWITPLYQACRHNHYEVVQWLVENVMETSDIDDGAAATPLGIAVILGHLRIVKLLISRGANTSQPVKERDISLHFLSAMKGNMAVFQFLVKNRIGCPKQGTGGRGQGYGSPIKTATRGGHLDMVEYLIQDADTTEITACLYVAIDSRQVKIVKLLVAKGADVNAADTGLTPLHHAVLAGDVDIVSILLNHGADARQQASDISLSAIHEMAKCGHVEMLEEVVRIAGGNEVASLNTPSGRYEETPLHKAAAHGHSTVVRYLLQICPMPVDLLDFKRFSALLYASSNGHHDAVRILVEHGASIECEAGHSSPLLLAAAEGHFEVVQYLCENGADVNVARGRGIKPLIAAVRHRSLGIVEYLLNECHADVNSHSAGEYSALSEAVIRGFSRIAQVLLAHGAHATNIEQDKSDLLCQAATRNQVGVVKLLLSAGVEVNARCSTTMQNVVVELTPLAIASAGGHLELVRLLCEHGADVEMATEPHESPLYLAALYGRLDVMKYLVDERNANVESASSFIQSSPGDMTEANSSITEYLLTRGVAQPGPNS